MTDAIKDGMTKAELHEAADQLGEMSDAATDIDEKLFLALAALNARIDAHAIRAREGR